MSLKHRSGLENCNEHVSENLTQKGPKESITYLMLSSLELLQEDRWSSVHPPHSSKDSPCGIIFRAPQVMLPSFREHMQILGIDKKTC